MELVEVLTLPLPWELLFEPFSLFEASGVAGTI